MGGARNPSGFGSHPPLALGIRGGRPGPSFALGHAVGNFVQPGIPATGLWHHQMRRPALAAPESKDFSHPGHRLLSSGLAVDPPRGPRRTPRSVAGHSRHLFWRNQFTGFWPPEMAFSMELIPLLKR